MNLIQKVGGVGMAEMILSEALTSAVLPNCYFHDIKLYGHVSDHDDVAYVFCEDTKQYLAYKPAKDACGEYVLLVDLKAELVGVTNDQLLNC
ncbi:hypothetical protein [Acinetobacter chengduensis]|uniref:Uncharacterized protein n=1 Tax=Acinetobacter chengduensis TaxID=2420890 RepID=A0ABX9TS07_9GAMM|nr:hypothetical protein [Acinetobacter chengduensis]RLL17989.1 hypothetical protein D9K81_16190 [Acinetobacter chengduensis]